MRHWWHARRAPAVVVVGVAAVLVPWLFSSTVWLVPIMIGGGSAAVELALLGLLAWSAVLVHALSARGRGPESRPVRNLGILDAAAVVAASTVVGLLGAVATTGSPVQVLGRSLLAGGVAGIAVALAGGRRGILAVTAVYLVTSSYGPRLEAASFVRVLEAEANPAWALACGVLAMVAAVACLLRWDRPPLAD